VGEFVKENGKHRTAVIIMSPQKDTEPLVTVDPTTGLLVYGKTKHEERMLDFSHCGYMGGGVPIPEAVVKIALDPSTTATSSPPDDTDRIQAAIDSLGVDNVKDDSDISAVLLRAGTYRVRGQLKMEKSGVVLRGQGDETVLVCAGNGQRSLISMSGGGPGPIYKKDGTFKIEDEKVRLGENVIQVKHGGTIKVGDTVYVQRNTNVRP